MNDLAERWVAEEPGNLLARDLLSSSYRKLADEQKLAGDNPAARLNYHKAIAIGRALLAAEPGNFLFKRHLATAADDLAGVAESQDQIAEARSLFEEAERLFGEQVAADPEDIESQFRLLRVQSRHASLERDDLHFPRASELFRSALQGLLRLDQQSRSGGGKGVKQREIRALKAEIVACDLAPTLLGDLAAVRARPAGEACLLLRIRIRAMAAESREAEVVETARALCDLAVDAAEDLNAQAHALVACVHQLDHPRWPTPPSTQRQAVRQRCADRAMDALNLALDSGLDDVQTIATDAILSPLRAHPGYPKLIERLRDPRRPLPRADKAPMEVPGSVDRGSARLVAPQDLSNLQRPK